jgi:uncharacterized protein (DUF1330 family)
MKYYAVAEIEITDRSPAYVKTVTRMVERYGGRYRARTSSVEKIEGDRKPPQIALIVEWHPETLPKLSTTARSTAPIGRVDSRERKMSSCSWLAKT